MSSRRLSKNLKKSDLLNLNKLYEDENTILKKEISVLNSLIKSQEERHNAETNSLLQENDSLKFHNSELMKTTIELQGALNSIRNDLGCIHRKTRNLKEKKGLQSSRELATSRIYNESENTPPIETQNTSRNSKRSLSKPKISPLRAGLIKDSKKISVLVSKLKRLKKT